MSVMEASVVVKILLRQLVSLPDSAMRPDAHSALPPGSSCAVQDAGAHGRLKESIKVMLVLGGKHRRAS
jgi:hypothetical protein